mgnify:CR=1 FL=1
MKRLLIILSVSIYGSLIAQDETSVMRFDEYLGYIKGYHPIAKQANLIIDESQAKLMKARGGFDPKIEVDYERKKFKNTEYFDKLNATFKIPTWYGIELKASFEEADGVFLNPEGTFPQDGLYSAKPGQLGFMEAASPIMEETVALHDLLMWIISAITLFVFFALAYIIVKFNAKANPVASKTTHNTLLEIVWTAIPILILVVISIPSFRLLYNQDVIPEADVTIKAIGNQWYWSYEYLDYEEIAFDAIMLEEGDDGYSDHPRLLGTDERIVVPVNKVIRVQVTANDVIHAWTIPAFGAKIDAVPGKLNETWFKATKEGLYYGQCSELCGIRHGFMPIMVDVVSDAEYEAWLEEAKAKYASNDAPRLQQYASAQSLTE